MYLAYLKTLAVFCVFLMGCLSPVKAGNTEKELRNDLFVVQGYKKDVRPVLQSSNVVPVRVQLTPLALRRVDDKLHTLTLDTWLFVVWNDEYLRWDPSQYGGLYNFRQPAHQLWVPDLAIYTGTPDSAIFPKVETNVVINQIGNVLWVPSFTMRSRCPELEIGATHVECIISLTSWSYDITQLDIHIKNATNMNYFEDNYPGWHLSSIIAEREVKTFNQESFSTINYKVNLTRRPIN